MQDIRLSVVIPKKIPLTQGKYALVDAEDYDYLNQWKWSYSTVGYAIRSIYLGGGRKNQKSKRVYMHALVNKTPKGFETDHINRDKLDNRKSNLRSLNRQQNSCNRALQFNNTSGFRGVTWHKDRKKWVAQIKVSKKNYYLGIFLTKEDAGRKYNSEAKIRFGEYAQLNMI